MKFKLFFLFISIVTFACSPGDGFEVYQGEAQGTTFLIKYRSMNTDLESSFDSIFELMDAEFSTYVPTSRITAFNKSKKGVEVSPSFSNVFESSWEYNILTNGYFDPTIAPVFQLYDFDNISDEEIDSSAIQSALINTGLHLIRLEDDSVVKMNEKVQLDFNAIAQGYTVDVLSELLELNEVAHYMVEVGGEIRAKGLNPSGKSWVIGIDRPQMNAQRRLMAKVELKDQALATSGNYRKFKKVNGVLTGHIINPKDGLPRFSNILSVSVLSENCMYSDALATACMCMSINEIMDLDNEVNDAGLYVVYLNQGDTSVYISPKIKDQLID